MEGRRYIIVVLLLAYKTCIQNYLQKILNSCFPSYPCLPTHPVSVEQDFENSNRLFVAPNFSMTQKIRLFIASTHRPPIPYMKPKATHNTVCFLNLFKHRGHKKPFPIPCSEPRLRTSLADGLPGSEKTPGKLQGKNCICSESGKGYSG